MIESVTSVCAGHEGASTAFWSNGLKAQVGVDDVSDEVLADESQAAEILGRMTTEDWG